MSTKYLFDDIFGQEIQFCVFYWVSKPPNPLKKTYYEDFGFVGSILVAYQHVLNES